MKFPKQIRVGKKLFTVSLVRNMSRRFTKGQTEYHTRNIQIARNSSDMRRRYTAVEKEETFWHELTHAILEDMNCPLYRNETFVDNFGRRLSNAIRSAKF